MFSCISDNFKDYTYYQNFEKSIEQRIVSFTSNKQTLQFNKFYQWKITIKWITLQDFMTYLEMDMISELGAYCYGDYQNKLEDFLNWFTSFGFEIVKANASVLKDTLPQWYQNEDKLIFSHTTEVVTIKNIDEVLLYQKSFDCQQNFLPVIVQDQVQEPIYKTLEYVRTRLQDNRMIFEKCISDLIQGALSQNDYQGWKQIFIEIDEIILDKLKESKQFSTIFNQQNENITGYQRRQIQIIISKIKQKIKDFNLHFSNFGIILSDFGESILLKLLLQNAIFVFWRFFCFEKMSKQKQIEQQQFLVHYLRFQADLQINQIGKSRYFGYLLGEFIQLQTITKLYEKQQMFHNQVIGDFIQEQSSFELVKRLDNEILLGIDKNVTDQQILEYITNQTNYIRKYIRQRILNIKQKISDQIEDELTLILKNAQKNIKHLCEFDIYPQNIQDYFDQLIDPYQASNLLYQILVNCLQGQINESLLDMIKLEYRDKFKNKEFYKFTDQLCNYDQLDIQIHDLYTFTLAFQQKIDRIISELKDFQIDFQKLNIKQQLIEIELKLIGCLEQCPMCGRKCDSEQYDKEHKHLCKNGHLLIGIKQNQLEMYINNSNKILPQLHSCEELQDDYIIFENNLQKTYWKQIKNLNQSWIFSYPTNKEQKEIYEKFMYIWNEKIRHQGRCVTFYKKRDYTQTTNYILILDNSVCKPLSIYLISFLKTINNNPDNRITIIQFEKSYSECQIDQQPLNPEKQIKKVRQIYFPKESLSYAYEIDLNNFDQFKEHQIFIYTKDSFVDQTHINLFTSIKAEKRKQIRFIVFSQGKLNQTDFHQGYKTFFQEYIKPDQFSQFCIQTLPMEM